MTERGLPPVSLVTLATDRELLSRMQASATFSSDLVEVDANGMGLNAAGGLNWGVDRAEHDWVVCVHQDVEFPDGWWESLWSQRRALPDSHGPLGVFGMTEAGAYIGHITDPLGTRRAGALPSEAIALDECVLVMHKSMHTRFDEAIPGFHMYGCDIVLANRAQGRPAFAVDAPLRHLSSGKRDAALADAQQAVLDKWGDEVGGVIPTINGVLRRAGNYSHIRYWKARAVASLSYRRMRWTDRGAAT